VSITFFGKLGLASCGNNRFIWHANYLTYVDFISFSAGNLSANERVPFLKLFFENSCFNQRDSMEYLWFAVLRVRCHWK